MDTYYPGWTSGLLSQNKKEKLVSYNQWLLMDGIKKGLISNKSKDYVWHEFIIHSLGFGLIIDKKYKSNTICDLGTGAGIPGIPIAIMHSKKKVYLVDRSEKRIFELERLKNLFDIKNIVPVLSAAEFFVSNNTEDIGIYVSRCFMPSVKLINHIFTNENHQMEALLVSSNNKKKEIKENAQFHVKQEEILINKRTRRNIDVITFK